MRIATTLIAALTIGLTVSGQSEAFESGRIEVKALGSGVPVLLVPGLSASSDVWSEIVGDLRDYQIHLVQVKGFAGLTAEENGEGEVIVAVADEIARYIDQSDLDDVSIIGHSMGGMVATLVAARYPDRVARLMSIDIPAFFGDIMGMSSAQIAEVAEQMRSETISRSQQAREAAERSFVEAGILDESKRAAVVADMLESDPVVSAQAQYEVMITDLRPELQNVTAPTTVVFVTPAQAPSMAPAEIEAFYAAQYADAPDLVLEFVADSGHYVMLDQPEQFAEIVGRFLD